MDDQKRLYLQSAIADCERRIEWAKRDSSSQDQHVLQMGGTPSRNPYTAAAIASWELQIAEAQAALDAA